MKAKERMTISGHSLHNMFITLKSKNEANALKWLHDLDFRKRHMLGVYWYKNEELRDYIQYLGVSQTVQATWQGR